MGQAVCRKQGLGVGSSLVLLVGALVLLSSKLAVAAPGPSSAHSRSGAVFLHIRSPTTEAEAQRRNAEDARVFQAIRALWEQPSSPDQPPPHAREEALLREVQERGRQPNRLAAHELQALASVGLELGQSFGSQGFYEVEVPPGSDPDTLLAHLREQGFTGSIAPPPAEMASVPNDPNWASGSTADQMEYPKAWESLTGGRLMKVCLIDSGVNARHPDLSENVVKTHNGLDGSTDVTDTNGHGTFTAGVIGARGDNGNGIAGVNWRTSLLACKAVGANNMPVWSAIINCMKWCRKEGAQVISTPISSLRRSVSVASAKLQDDPLAMEIYESKKAGQLFVVSVGNHGKEMTDTEWVYPACLHVSNPELDNMIVVGGVDSDFGRWVNTTANMGSNYGSRCVHMFGRGAAVMGTWRQGGYEIRSGTSVAAAQVAGAAALVWLARPFASYADVKQALLRGGNPHPGSTHSSSGNVLDVAKALRADPISLPEPIAADPAVKDSHVLTVAMRATTNASLCWYLDDAQGSVLTQSECRPGSMNQIFSLHWFGKRSEFTIRNKGACLDVANLSHDHGARIQRRSCGPPASPLDNQRFAAFPMYDKEFQVRARHSSLCLDVAQNSARAGAPIIQHMCRSRTDGLSTAQRFRPFLYYESGLTELVGRIQTRIENRTRCLDLEKGSKGPGTRIVQNTCSNAETQLFRFRKVGITSGGDYWYRIVGERTGLNLELDDKDNGERLQQNTIRTGRLSQEFYMVREFGGPFQGPYHIISRNSLKCMDGYLRSTATEEGTRVHQWDCHFKQNQDFYLDLMLN